MEPLLDYLERNMEVLFQKLESNLFPLFWEEIWKAEMRVVGHTLLEGVGKYNYLFADKQIDPG